MRPWSKPISVIVAWSAFLGAQACLNDRDSIEVPGQGDTVAAISGWFDHNPPQYYQMRIDRLVAASKKGQLTASEYDDLAVAYDRVGKDDEALRWIQQKFALMHKHGFKKPYRIAPEKSPMGKEVSYKDLTPEEYHQYSTQANWGTFLIHRWLRAGEPLDRVKEAVAAHDHIEQAIEINPDAHAGREWAQADIIQWIIDARTGKKPGYPAFQTGHGVEDTIRGLGGLIMLGNAWESLDIYLILQHELASNNQGVLASLRAQELLSKGAKSLGGLKLETPPGDVDRYRDFYKELRATAEKARADRDAYMQERFRQGRHPDTDPTFWNDYTRPRRPIMPAPFWTRFWMQYVWVVACPGLPILAVLLLFKRARNAGRKVATTKSS